MIKHLVFVGCALLVAAADIWPLGDIARNRVDDQTRMQRVAVPFLVVDEGGQVVSGLRPSDLVVTSAGIQVSVRELEHPAGTASLGRDVILVFDTIALSKEDLHASRAIAEQILDAAGEGDWFSVVDISAKVPFLQGPTRNRLNVRETLRPLSGSGSVLCRTTQTSGALTSLLSGWAGAIPPTIVLFTAGSPRLQGVSVRGCRYGDESRAILARAASETPAWVLAITATDLDPNIQEMSQVVGVLHGRLASLTNRRALDRELATLRSVSFGHALIDVEGIGGDNCIRVHVTSSGSNRRVLAPTCIQISDAAAVGKVAAGVGRYRSRPVRIATLETWRDGNRIVAPYFEFDEPGVGLKASTIGVFDRQSNLIARVTPELREDGDGTLGVFSVPSGAARIRVALVDKSDGIAAVDIELAPTAPVVAGLTRSSVVVGREVRGRIVPSFRFRPGDVLSAEFELLDLRAGALPQVTFKVPPAHTGNDGPDLVADVHADGNVATVRVRFEVPRSALGGKMEIVFAVSYRGAVDHLRQTIQISL